MPREGKSALTVSDETVETLKDHKPDRNTWDEFLTRAARAAEPQPDGVEDDTKISIEYYATKEDGTEVYFWPVAEKFLVVPPRQVHYRECKQLLTSYGYDVSTQTTEDEIQMTVKNRSQ